jgi:hypothetical protein
VSYVSTLIGKISSRKQRAHAQAAANRAAVLAGAVEALEGRRLLSTVSISSPSVNEGGNLVYTVSLDQASNKAVTVNYNTSGGTAKSGRDFIAPKAGKLTFAAGQTSKTITVKSKDNNLFSANKTLLMKLSGVNSGNKIQGKGTGTGTIVNTDAAPKIVVNNARVVEGQAGNKVMVFNVKMTGRSETPVKISYQTVNNGPATSKGKNADFNAAKGTLTFNNAGTQQVRVVVRGDKTQEANEAFLLKLTAAKGTTATLPDLGYAVGIITNDDKGNVSAGTTVTSVPPAVSINPGTTAGVTIRLNQVSADDVTVQYATANGSATAGSDYTPMIGSVTFKPGEVEKVIEIPTTSAAGAGETFSFNLTDPTKATIADGTSTITITDAALPALSVTDTSVAEGNAGTKNVTFTVSLSAAASQPITVGYTLGGTATAGSDYTGAASGTLSFAAGQTSKTVTVAVLGDTAEESDETITLTLGQPVNAPITKSVGTATIINDDGGTVAGPNDGQGIAFGSNTGHTFVLGKLSKFNYELTSSRTTPMTDLVMEFYMGPSNTTDLTTLTPYKTVTIGTINPGQTLTGSVDLSGSPDLTSGTRYFTRLVSNGVQYDVETSIPKN